MAKLFKDKTIKKNLEKFVIPNFEGKIEIIKKWFDAYKNKTLHQKTETQCEQAFNQSFFVELLGYTTFPNPIYTIDPKASTELGSQKPDAALGYFSIEQTRVIAVVEIKDVNTALDRSQKREGNLSPVQQAFKYKPQFKECNFVIATNFFEIRLHKDNQLDYEQFTLEKLADPKNDYFELRKFYYLLCADNFISKAGRTKTEELLSDIRVDQQKITKKFYQDYKLLRQELIKDIVKNNSVQKNAKELLLIIEKAQKIIDRIVFVCFCEDRDLLPENTLQSVIKHAENSFSNQWDLLKGFFNAIDRGSEKLTIPHGYDGGLFAEDQKLNNLKISDEVCKKFLEFGNYDFSEDLTVNILGHIFEQSISDIEEIKTKTIEGESADKKKSKRKKEGIFYTPDYIVDYIVRNSLGKYLEEKEDSIKEANNLKEHINDTNYKKRALKAYIEYQSALRNIKVLDPACGSGAFLVKVFDYLYAENVRVANIIADLNDDRTDLFSSEDYIKSLLQNNIFGVDLNPESVEITKLSLWLKTAQKDKKLVDLNNNIKCGNSLIDDKTVAGERAFKWGEEFKEIIDNGRFDVVLGNPPYVFAREKISESEKGYFSAHFASSEYQVNTFVLFIEKSVNLIKKGGFLGFIIPNSILKISSISKLRKFLLEQGWIRNIVQLFGESFEGINVETIIFIFQKGNQGADTNILEIYNPREIDEKSYRIIDSTKWKNDPEYRFQLSIDDKAEVLLEKIKTGSADLESLFDVKAGLQAYEAGKGNPAQSAEDVKKRPYDCTSRLDSSTFQYLEGKDVGRYYIEWLGIWLKYGDCLAAPRTLDIFQRPRILIREITGRYPQSLICTYTDEVFLNNRSVVNILNHANDKELLKTLLLILNSSLIGYYFKKITPKSERKMFPKIILQDLRKFPIKLPKDKKVFANKADLILDLYSQFYEKIKKFLKLIQSEFSIEKTTKKLEKFYELDFDGFIKELKLKKISLEKKEELLAFFEKYKKELLGLKNQIDATDKEIDEMVFDLYGLSESEREIVLES